jgi:hypothetical protein
MENRIAELERENAELKEKLRLIECFGWKGKDDIVFNHIGTDWHILEHRKDKDSGEVALSSHVIPEMEILKVWELIKARVSLREKTPARKLWLDIITAKNLPISLDEFNGGRNRSKYYFPYYYYPVKVLEHLGFIHYGGRGQIVRLKE